MGAKKTSVGAVGGVLVAVIAIGAAVWYIACDPDAKPEQAGKPISVSAKKGGGKESGKSVKGKSVRIKGVAVSGQSVKRQQPDLNLEAQEEAKLTEQMLAIYRDLQTALDKEDGKRVIALVHKLQSMDEWPDDIPASVKKRALSALAWFGAAGIAEAIGFLADANQEVRDMAVETFKNQLNDSWDLGDRKLGETLVSMSKVVTDADALDSFYDQLDHMRPSVRAQTVSDIYKSGTDSAKQAMDKKLESVFMNDDVQVTERSGVDEALKSALEKESSAEVSKEYDEQYGPGNWDW